MTQIFAASTGPETWRTRLADPEKHWRDGYSAKLTAESWETSKGLPTEIAQLLGSNAALQLALIEHKVPLAGGGADSQCDVFALVRADNRDIAMAVEAKVNEPFGPLLSEWYHEPSAGKVKRLRAICEMLGLPDPETTPLSGSLRYQLFHRTAAAVVEARRFHRPVAAMIVQSFAPDHRWFADYAAFCALFGLTVAPQKSAECTLPCGTVLILGWACGTPAAPYPKTLTGT